MESARGIFWSFLFQLPVTWWFFQDQKLFYVRIERVKLYNTLDLILNAYFTNAAKAKSLYDLDQKLIQLTHGTCRAVHASWLSFWLLTITPWNKKQQNLWNWSTTLATVWSQGRPDQEDLNSAVFTFFSNFVSLV